MTLTPPNQVAARLRPAHLAVRYVLFAVIAGAMNLGAQAVVFAIAPIQPLALSILAGTGVGFVVKYLLDKRWIFFDDYHGPAREARKILLYGAFSVAMTLLLSGRLGRRFGQIRRRRDRTGDRQLPQIPARSSLYLQSEIATGSGKEGGVMELMGWARYPRFETRVFKPATPAEAARLQSTLDGTVARGNGRAYGDAAIGAASCLCALGLDRFHHFDESDGRLAVEAGVLLSDIIAAFLPRGFFPPVVPGTKFVSVGGMVAADVHGKNHHGAGGFGDHVEAFDLALPDGQVSTCSRRENIDLFAATIGGMGLTGTILSATFRLLPLETAWIRQETVVARNLAESIAVLTARDEAPYSAAWIDCLATGESLGRSLVYLGRHASRSEVDALAGARGVRAATKPGRRLSVPVELPGFTLNRWSVAAFNEVYFRRGAATAGPPFLTRIEPFFFPLDGVLNWNRIYGRRGFLQHQSVIDARHAEAAIGEILTHFARRGNASFLAVLKKLGPAARGLLSFPSPGFTLALDVAIDRGVFDFLDEIDKIVVAAGGRIYLAEDARQSRTTFAAGYPNLEKFRTIRRQIGADRRIASRLSDRLGI
jgi:FAD/FMN-containing dehydrogenase/putative flippase GtrA